jgi:hypothetical protein
MKKRKGILFVLLPLVITLALFVVFYSRIECKPGDAGFWFVIALGMAIGVALTRFSLWSKTNKTDNE